MHALHFWFDKNFEIESKYHRKIVVLFLKARILSLQDVVFRSMFFLISEDKYTCYDNIYKDQLRQLYTVYL